MTSSYMLTLKLTIDYVVLQEALYALAAWADEWQLSVSIDKCSVLYVGKGGCSAPHHHHHIRLL